MWVEEQVIQAGVKLDSSALALVTGWMGEDAGRLGGVLDTLRSIYGGGVKLNAAQIEPYLGIAGSVPPWDLTDAIDRGDTKVALELLERMRQARHPLQILATVHNHFLRFLKLDGADATSEGAAAEALGIKPGFPAKKAYEQFQRLGGSGAQKAIGLIAQADLDLRGQRELPEDLVMEVLIARLSKLAPTSRRR